MNILPANVVDDLSALADGEDRSLWAIGRIAKTTAKELPKTVRRSALDEEIAQSCRWKASRARDVRSVVTYYPDQIEDEFPALSFSHHRCAMSAGTLDRSLTWLNWCLSSADEYGGMPAPCDVLAAKMRDAGDKVAMPLHEKWLAQIGRLLNKLYVHSSTPPGIRTKLEAVMIAFDKAFPDIEDM